MSQDPRIERAAIAIWAEASGKKATDWVYMAPEDERVQWGMNLGATAVAAIDKAGTITTVEELDALPVGAVVLGWAVIGSTPYLRCRTARGRLAWGCVGEEAIYESANLLQGDTTARVIHWGTE